MTDPNATYSHAEHLHRFACWTAARAAQRGWAGATTKTITKALEDTEFAANLQETFDSSPDSKMFDAWHSSRVQEIGEVLLKLDLEPKGITYGRIAKIIAVYIKTVYITAYPDSSLARVAHPPIDAILLRNLKKSQKAKDIGFQYPARLGVHWTKFTKEDYSRALEYLRAINQGKPLWSIEEFWLG